MSAELHAVFAVTVFGDKIRVSNYADWNRAQSLWNYLDTENRVEGTYSLVNYFAVRSWEDPEWNLSRYRSMDTVERESEEFQPSSYIATVRDPSERRIACIKNIRQATGMGLREAKLAMEGQPFKIEKDQLAELVSLFRQDGMAITSVKDRS